MQSLSKLATIVPAEFRPVMLVVESGAAQSGAGRLSGPGLHFVSYADLDQGLLKQIRPDIVVAALMSPVIDALDLAERLESLGYRGRFWALASAVPKVPMVREEVCAIAPGIDFEIVTLATLSDLIEARQARRQAAP